MSVKVLGLKPLGHQNAFGHCENQTILMSEWSQSQKSSVGLKRQSAFGLPGAILEPFSASASQVVCQSFEIETTRSSKWFGPLNLKTLARNLQNGFDDQHVSISEVLCGIEANICLWLPWCNFGAVFSLGISCCLSKFCD